MPQPNADETRKAHATIRQTMTNSSRKQRHGSCSYNLWLLTVHLESSEALSYPHLRGSTHTHPKSETFAKTQWRSPGIHMQRYIFYYHVKNTKRKLPRMQQWLWSTLGWECWPESTFSIVASAWKPKLNNPTLGVRMKQCWKPMDGIANNIGW